MAKMQQQSYSTFLRQQQASDVAKQVSTYSGELKYLNDAGSRPTARRQPTRHPTRS